MEKDALTLLEKINWVLNPISDAIIFLFTTGTGHAILISAFVIYLLATIINSMRVRQLLIQGSSNYGRGRIPIVEKLYLLIRDVAKSLVNIATNLPVLLGIFVVMIFIVGLSSGLKSIENYVKNKEKIQELSTIVRQLDKSYKVAEMEVLSQNYLEGTSTIKFDFFDYADLGAVVDSQTITLKGSDIYLDALVLNFDYSEIVGNEKRNITVPYRVFSNMVPAAEAIKIEMKGDNGVPYIFNRSADNIYGMDESVYTEGLLEIIGFMEDSEKAKKAGVRSFTGNAVHRRVRTGDKLEVWVEQTGGLVMKNANGF